MNLFFYITAVLMGVLSLVFFIFSYRQFKEKGKPLNNAYLYASKNERESKNFSPHYRQSAIVFALLGATFLLMAINAIIYIAWFKYLLITLFLCIILYAIISSIYIIKRYGY